MDVYSYILSYSVHVFVLIFQHPRKSLETLEGCPNEIAYYLIKTSCIVIVE